MYVFDSTIDAQVNARSSIISGLNRAFLETIQRVMNEFNALAKRFISAGEQLRNREDVESVQLILHEDLPNLDQRRYNRPAADEVAAIMIGGDLDTRGRDIIVRARNQSGNTLQRIYESHQQYDPLQYPLLFPYGEVGWDFNLRMTNGKRISPRSYAAYRLMTRPHQYSLLHRAGRLFQQYCVDQYAKIEQQRLLFQMNNQQALRADLYAGFADAVRQDQPVMNDVAAEHAARHAVQQRSTAVASAPQPNAPQSSTRTERQSIRMMDKGTRLLLALSFTGSNRYMREQYQDAMAMVRAYGKPDLFVTVTCNPKWQEITRELLPGQ
jgi:hypothetical protein